ncbi:MAG: hypothetical protein HXS46_05120 [Theionarchaea archaeon]|nr:hypothetical protein [Theionarchaea archaeon]
MFTIDTVILLGYVGIIISVVTILKEHIIDKAPIQKNKYPTKAEKETLIKMKKFIRYLIMLCVLGCIGIWFLKGDFPTKYVHLVILIVVNLLLGYIRISVQEKSSRFPSPPELQRDRRKENFPRNIKIVMCINALVLLFFCVLFVHSRSAPFYGIWGIIAWAGTLFVSYSPVVLVHELFESEKRPPYLLSLPLSWIFVFFWLGLGLGDEMFQDISKILIILFVIGLWIYGMCRKIR